MYAALTVTINFPEASHSLAYFLCPDVDDLPKRDRMGGNRDASKRNGGRDDARRGGVDRAGGNVVANKGRAGSRAAVLPGQTAPGAVWTLNEDNLLQAVVREFCPLKQNWALVSDVISTGSGLRGVFRRPEQCKYRWEHLGKLSHSRPGLSILAPSLSSRN